jgi:RNA polymerase sigma-70 factor (ECF subfamily)
MSENLIQRWIDNGDERAAEALYQAHYRRVYRLAYALLGNTSDAEEAMHNIMIYGLKHTKSYDPQQASFTTWLHTIAVGHCRDRQREHGARHGSGSGDEGDAGTAVGQAPGPRGGPNAREGQNEFWQALDQLNPKLREAIVLRYWSGHTYQEMAEILRCPVPTAQSRVRLAYEQLRKLLHPTGVRALGEENLQ